MSLEVGSANAGAIQARQELQSLNALSGQYGLELTENQLLELQEGRKRALEDTGRVEFGGGVLPKLVYAFCDSPFLSREDYAQTLLSLQELFYALKKESADQLSDDELIEYMERVYNGRAQGAMEVLEGASLGEIWRWAREEREAELGEALDEWE